MKKYEVYKECYIDNDSDKCSVTEVNTVTEETLMIYLYRLTKNTTWENDQEIKDCYNEVIKECTAEQPVLWGLIPQTIIYKDLTYCGQDVNLCFKLIKEDKK